MRATLQLLDFDDKRIHYFLELRHATEGWIAATSENLSIHVDMASKKASPFPADILTHLALLKAAHAGLKRPDGLGHVMGVKKKAEAPQAETVGTRH